MFPSGAEQCARISANLGCSAPCPPGQGTPRWPGHVQDT